MNSWGNLLMGGRKRSDLWLQRVLGQRWFNLGLRAKMGLMVTVGLLGLLTIFALLGISTTRQATQQVLSERVMLARLTAFSLDTRLHHAHEMLTILADQDVLRQPETSLSVLEVSLSQLALPNQGVYLFDREARLLATTMSDERHIDWQASSALQDALKGEHFNLTIVQSPTDFYQALIAVPVWGPAGMPSGSLAMLLNLSEDSLFPMENPLPLGGSGRLEVVDASGRVLVSTLGEIVSEAKEPNSIVGNFFVAGEPGVETCLGCYGDNNSQNFDEVVAFAPLSQVPWGVVVRQKALEVFQPVRRLTAITIGLGLATITGALGLVWVTTNSVINPVQNLTEAARRIAEGDLSTPISAPLSEWPFNRNRRRDEIGALADSFITMRRQLKRSIDEIQTLNRDLDARVQARAQEALAAQLEAQAARDDLRAVIDALSDELVVIDVKQHTLLQANRAVQRLHSGDILGSLCYEVLHGDSLCQPPERDCPIGTVLSSGKSTRITHVRKCRQNGDSCYVDIVASPMRDAEGNITRIVELIRDVTEEKRVKESLVRRNQQLSIVNSVAMTVNQSLDLHDILGRALDEVLNLTEIDAGAVFLQEDALSGLNLMAYRGLSEQAARLASQMGMLDSGCGGIMEKGQIVIVPDLSRYRGQRARSLRRNHLSTLVHIPLTSKGCTLGSMCVGTREKRNFSQEEQALLSALGSQIAVAVENARLYAEVQRKEQMRGELFKKAINAQEEERKRIARELHDDTSQALTALLFAAEESLEMECLDDVKRRLDRMQSLAQNTLDGVHKLIFDLRPSMLDHLGLVPALSWFADSRLASRGIRVKMKELNEPCRLPAEVETALFRVVQEAITNVARHSAARNVDMVIDFAEDMAEVSLEDDGIGFDIIRLEISPDNPRGLGLLGMQERVELMGGELEIHSSPGHGTKIRIRLPLPNGSVAYA